MQKKTSRKGKSIILRVAVVLFLLYVGISLISLRIEIVNSKAALNEEKQVLEEQILENRELEAMVEAGNDEEKIERIARDMGYIYPDEQVVILTNGN